MVRKLLVAFRGPEEDVFHLSPEAAAATEIELHGLNSNISLQNWE